MGASSTVGVSLNKDTVGNGEDGSETRQKTDEILEKFSEERRNREEAKRSDKSSKVSSDSDP